jgi:hypothetical protein
MRLALLLALAAGCSDPSTDDDIRAQVTLLLNQEGAAAQAASARLQRHGRRAIVTIEAALHTATPDGRKNLILALRGIGDGEAIPLLRHVAIYDPSAEVRREAEWTLKQWAQAGQARGERARAALREIDEARAREEPG